MSLLLMWKQQLLMNNFKYFSLTGSGSLLLPGSIKGKFKELTLSGTSVQGENPSPDNPQEIKSAGRKSRNLLIENISVFTVQDNIAYMPLPEGHETQQYTMLIRKKPNKNDDIGFSCGFYDKSNASEVYSAPCLKDGKLINENGIVNSEVGVNHFICFKPANEKFFDIYNVMYVEGKETTLDYEPYGYLFDVKVMGKNIFNKNATKQGYEFGAMLSDVETVKQGWFVSDFMPVKATTYQISGKTTGYGCKLYSKDKVFVKNIQAPFGGIKFDEGIAYFRINGEIKDLDKVQVEEGNVVTPHEPYTEQSVQIALDKPLRGIREYKDTIAKDGIVRKVKRVVLDGSENWWIHKEKENTVSFYTNSFKFLFPTHNTMFVDKFSYAISGMNKEDISWSVYGGNFFININKSDASNLVDFKTWLSKNPVTVEYIDIAKEPITEPLPESVQAQLQALHSENGVTHVIIDSGEVAAEISATYMRK